MPNPIDFILHIDQHLQSGMQVMGVWLYLVLFLIVFCETGLVVTPFLPGDSLLFAVGALCALEGSPLQVGWALTLLILAAVLGDAVNYTIGNYIGPRIFTQETGRWLNKRHLLRAQAFYERHGGKAIILARFAPFLRTFAPFVAGIGKMSYPRFARYNVIGGMAWVGIFVLAGYWFAENPLIKGKFHWVIIAIIVLSLIPVVVEYLRSRREPKVAA